MAESVDAPDLKSVEDYPRGSSSLPTRTVLNKHVGQKKHPTMKYRIETNYAWYNRETMLILIYFIQGIPFTFDELPEIARQHPEVLQIAKEEKSWEPEELYQASMYLMMEECHPMMYELDIENPELLPLD